MRGYSKHAHSVDDFFSFCISALRPLRGSKHGHSVDDFFFLRRGRVSIDFFSFFLPALRSLRGGTENGQSGDDVSTRPSDEGGRGRSVSLIR